MPEPELNLGDIQGNILAGFNKDHQSFLFVSFSQAEGAKAWLKELAPEVASSSEVRAFNSLFKEVNQRRGGERGTVKATWVNVALSASGLQTLGVPAEQQGAFSQAFREGMKARAQTIGDLGANAPEHWQAPLGSSEVHAVVLIASDEREDMDREALRQIERLGEHDLKLLFKQDGKARSDLPGHEHFGFKDGISQPGIKGFTKESKPTPTRGNPARTSCGQASSCSATKPKREPPSHRPQPPILNQDHMKAGAANRRPYQSTKNSRSRLKPGL
jgi:deferrochelatase/peroxidase EfeB